MKRIKYTGKEGWAKLPELDLSNFNFTELQRTFFRLHSGPQPKTTNFEPPLKKEGRVTGRKPRKGTFDKNQMQLCFEEEKATEVHPAEKGFSSVFVTPPSGSGNSVKLSNGNDLPVPGSLKELKELFKLDVLNTEGSLSIPGQLEATAIALSSDDNKAFHGPTGGGKTFVQMYIASHYLSKNVPVLLLAPTEVLVAQHAKKAMALLDIKEDQVCLLTGETPPEKRAALHRNAGYKLFISTPETLVNDITAGTADPSRFGLVMYDEAHRAVGKYAYVVADQEFPESTRRILFSATIAKNFPTVIQLMERMNINECHEIKVPETRRFEAAFYSRITEEGDPTLYNSSKRIYNAVVTSALRFHHSLLHACEFRDGVAHTALLKNFRKQTNILKCQEQVESDRQDEKCKFSFPSYREFQKIGDTLNALAEQNPKRFGRLCSQFYELQHLIYLYVLLTCEGKHSFLKAAGQKLWDIRFSGKSRDFADYTKKDSPRNFHLRIYKNPLILRSFAELAKGTLFNHLQLKTSHQFNSLIRAAFPEDYKDGDKVPAALAALSREQLKRRFFDKARKELIESDYVDHPSELKMLSFVLRHTSFGANERIIVYEHSAQRTKFYMERLNYQLRKMGVKAGFVVGKKHETRKMRDEYLNLFKNGELDILGTNSAANEGLDIAKVRILIRLSFSTQPIERIQTAGRVGRGDLSEFSISEDDFAYIYNLISLGTHNEYRYYAGLRNSKILRRDMKKLQYLVIEGNMAA